ncbi:MAG: hypothetical protein JWP69_2126 [Flaviaesturariibacter sp.]|nr:hypothetical protein [Flaviaesturariibacter sp.]
MRKSVIKWGCLLSVFVISITAKAAEPAISVNPYALSPAAAGNCFAEGISDKLAADSRFMELV